MEMYENIQKGKRDVARSRRRDWGIVIPLLLVCIVLIAIIGTIIWCAGTYPRYWKYVEELSESTHYSYENESLKVYKNGKPMQVEKDNAYYVFKYLSLNGIGARRRKVPEKACEFQIEYGDGASLTIWRITKEEEAEYAEGDKMFVWFHKDDYDYMYTIGSKNADELGRHLER